MRLKNNILTSIRTQKRLKIALMDYFDVSPATLYRWLDQNNRSFTEYKALQIIASYLGHDEIVDLVDDPIPGLIGA